MTGAEAVVNDDLVENFFVPKQRDFKRPGRVSTMYRGATYRRYRIQRVSEPLARRLMENLSFALTSALALCFHWHRPRIGTKA